MQVAHWFSLSNLSFWVWMVDGCVHIMPTGHSEKQSKDKTFVKLGKHKKDTKEG